MSEGVEEFIPEEEAEGGSAALKKLREKLKKAIEEKQEYLEGWQRSRADFVNYKKEEAALHKDKEVRIKGDILKELLPALDALELALRHLPAQAGHSDKTLTMLQKQFLDALGRLGIERFGEVGEEFDLGRHEALAKNGEDHVVASVERSGYKIDNTIIRPAQVII